MGQNSVIGNNRIRSEKMSANAPQPTTTTWNIDPVHTVAEFKVRHMMITNVKGHFTGVTGVLTLDEQDVTKSHVEASIDAATINTREADRDTHLKSADFLDVEKFPTLTFASTRITRTGDEELQVEGDLTIHRSEEHTSELQSLAYL